MHVPAGCSVPSPRDARRTRQSACSSAVTCTGRGRERKGQHSALWRERHGRTQCGEGRGVGAGEQRKGWGKASQGLSTGSSPVSASLGSPLASGAGSRICCFLSASALAAGRPWRKNHDEHVDAAERLSPDNRHGEREERTREAGALQERTRGRLRNWVTFRAEHLGCSLGNTCPVRWTFFSECSCLDCWSISVKSLYPMKSSYTPPSSQEGKCGFKPWFISIKLIIDHDFNLLLFCSLMGW